MKPTPLAKLSTGVPGLDEILDGGLPHERTTLINGSTGCGKTIMGLQVAYRNAAAGRPAVFVSLEESADAVRRNAATLGWDLGELEAAGTLRILDLKLDLAALRIGSFDLSGLRAIMQGLVEQTGAVVVVMDSLDAAFDIFDHEGKQERELITLLRWFADRAMTVVLTAKRFVEASEPKLLDFLSDCVIDLDQRVVGQVTTRRLRIAKYRGSSYAGNEYPFVIDGHGIRLLPITDAELPEGASGSPVSLGASDLDEILGGGFRRGASVLIAGPTGSGKTTLACSFAVAVAARGDRVLYCSYEESAAELLQSMESTGIGLAPAVDAGAVRILTTMPEAMGVEAHLFRIVDAMDTFDPQHIVVDAITAAQRMGTEQASFDFLIRLASEAKRRGITCVYTSQTRTIDISEVSGVSGLGISSLIDTIISLRYVVEEKALTRELLALKSRGMRHSNLYHAFEITDSGFRVKADTETPA